MMKKLLFLIFFPIWAFGQSDPCGKLVKLGTSYSEWQNSRWQLPHKQHDVHNWVEDILRQSETWVTDAVAHGPCYIRPSQFYQNRICTIEGEQQTRQIQESWGYLPPQRSKYQKVLDSLRKLK